MRATELKSRHVNKRTPKSWSPEPQQLSGRAEKLTEVREMDSGDGPWEYNLEVQVSIIVC